MCVYVCRVLVLGHVCVTLRAVFVLITAAFCSVCAYVCIVWWWCCCHTGGALDAANVMLLLGGFVVVAQLNTISVDVGGVHLVTSSTDATVRLWDARSWQVDSKGTLQSSRSHSARCRVAQCDASHRSALQLCSAACNCSPSISPAPPNLACSRGQGQARGYGVPRRGVPGRVLQPHRVRPCLVYLL
jgi:hypothetical protein